MRIGDSFWVGEKAIQDRDSRREACADGPCSCDWISSQSNCNHGESSAELGAETISGLETSDSYNILAPSICAMTWFGELTLRNVWFAIMGKKPVVCSCVQPRTWTALISAQRCDVLIRCSGPDINKLVRRVKRQARNRP
jgi:hypothetical protein